MKRWMVMAAGAFAAAGASWGRGVPAYREYTREVNWGTESALSGEVGVDEAQRLELRAAAARAEIVGEAGALDWIREGSSPFARGGVAGGMAGPGDGDDGTERKRKKKDDNWLMEGLELASLTTTNQAVLEGLRGVEEDGEEGTWGWLAEDVQERGAAAEEEIAKRAEAVAWGEETSEEWPGIGGNERQEWTRPEEGGGERRVGVEDSGESREPVAAPAVAMSPGGGGTAVPDSGRGAAMPEVGEMTRVKELLSQIAGDNAVPGRGDLSGGGLAGLTGGGANAFAPDWDSLLKGGAPGGGAGTGETGGATAGGTGWGGESRAEVAAPGGGAGWRWDGGGVGTRGWGAGESAGGGGWNWSGAGNGGAGGESGGWGGGGFSADAWKTPGDGFATKGGGIADSWGVGSGISDKKAWVETRPAGGVYRPAWD